MGNAELRILSSNLIAGTNSLIQTSRKIFCPICGKTGCGDCVHATIHSFNHFGVSVPCNHSLFHWLFLLQ
nr:MAG TPA: E3 ubiquitin-protein ligase [Caudoviricetes sp.]